MRVIKLKETKQFLDWTNHAYYFAHWYVKSIDRQNFCICM